MRSNRSQDDEPLARVRFVQNGQGLGRWLLQVEATGWPQADALRALSLDRLDFTELNRSMLVAHAGYSIRIDRSGNVELLASGRARAVLLLWLEDLLHGARQTEPPRQAG